VQVIGIGWQYSSINVMAFFLLLFGQGNICKQKDSLMISSLLFVLTQKVIKKVKNERCTSRSFGSFVQHLYYCSINIYHSQLFTSKVSIFIFRVLFSNYYEFISLSVYSCTKRKSTIGKDGL